MAFKKYFTLHALQGWLSAFALCWFLIFSHFGHDDAPFYSMAKQWTIFLIIAALVGIYCVFKPLFKKVNSTKIWVRAWQLCGLTLLFCVSFVAISVGGFWLREQFLMWLAA